MQKSPDSNAVKDLKNIKETDIVIFKIENVFQQYMESKTITFSR